MLTIRAIRLRSFTGSNQYGADLNFPSGLNIIQAHNTSGKSTCLQSILYALGLERSLGPQLEVPLPYAMRQRIRSNENSPYELVLQSFVELVIENQLGHILTIHRDIEGGADRKLIRTILATRDGAIEASPRDFFVHDPGSAQREDGFHNFLCKFIGWTIPVVPRFDGSEGPLYIEAIIPMFFVEQKRGWSVTQGPFPTYFKIQDVSRRVMEFILDLDAGRIRRERAELRQALAASEQQWSTLKKRLLDAAGPLIRFTNILDIPSAEFRHADLPEMEVFEENQWTSLDNALSLKKQKVAILESLPAVSSEANAEEIQKQLADLRRRVDELSGKLAGVRADHNAYQQERNATQIRIDALVADLRRNQDALKLKGLGSTLGTAASTEVCPTCHQELTHELMPTASSTGMAIEENIKFINSQLDLHRASLRSIESAIQQTEIAYRGIFNDLGQSQQSVRSLSQALLQPSDHPSIARLEELVRARAEVGRLSHAQEIADGALDELKSIASIWSEIKERLKKLTGIDLSPEDNEKIRQLGMELRSLLGNFGFKTFPVGEVALSDDNFRPLIRRLNEDGIEVEQELGFEVSASDAIRLKWAFYLALLSISRSGKTNHLGTVVFDEPGQQEIESTSLFSMLAWATERLGANQQLIIATSEPIEEVHRNLENRSYNVITFNGFILQPMQS